jgi:hypothetical protein
MSIQFPDTPTQGDSFTASNGVIYTYNNGGWMANSVSGLDDTYVNRTGDTMTGDLTVPNLISEGDVQTTSLNGGQLAGFRNQLINGDFRVMQRADGSNNVVTSPTGTNYTFDRWITNSNSTTSKRLDGNGIPVAQVLSGGSPIHLVQGIELNTVLSPSVGVQGFPLGSQWTLSYYSDKTPSSVGQIVEYRDGTAIQTNIVAITGVPLPTATGKTLGSYTQYSTTFTINASPLATSRCLVVHISTSDTSSVTFAYAQLEPGPVATPFEHRPIGTELALCQRYYETGRYYGQSGGALNGAWGDTINFASTKRVTPTNTFANTIGTVDGQDSPRASSIGFYGTPSAGGEIAFNWTADAEL